MGTNYVKSKEKSITHWTGARFCAQSSLIEQLQRPMVYLWMWWAYRVSEDLNHAGGIQIHISCGVLPEKIPEPYHNALLPMAYFVQVVMWIVSDKTS